MCLERLFVGLRAMVNATCESLATVVVAPSVPCSSTSVSDTYQRTLQMHAWSTNDTYAPHKYHVTPKQSLNGYIHTPWKIGGLYSPN